jgi:hypothetical protein
LTLPSLDPHLGQAPLSSHVLSILIPIKNFII